MNDQPAEKLLELLERIAVALEGENSVANQSSNRQTDRIRQYVKEKYIDPARRRGAKTITIKAGEISTEMRIKNGQPPLLGL